MSSPLKLANNAFGRLASNRSTGDTTLVLQSGDGAKFPALAAGEYFPATLVRSWDGAIEIVKVTARSTDSLTVQRAQESTAALAFLAGDRVELRLTAGTFGTEVARVEGKADAAQEKADSSVQLTGNQTIAGTKTFSSSPVVPTPTANTQAAHKQYVDQAAQSAVTEASPAGTVVFVATNTAPAGYLKANGAAISRTTYAALFAAIGTTFGAGNGWSTFNLPDLRGEFLRGWDDGRGVDSGRAFGSGQLDQMQRITASTQVGNNYREGWVSPTGAFTATNSTVVSNNSGTSITGPATLNFDSRNSPNARVSSTTSGETRSRNVALLACIKF